MITVGEIYEALADGIVDALQNLRDHNFGLAEARLRRAQQTAEELFSKLWEEEVRREVGVDISGIEIDL